MNRGEQYTGASFLQSFELIRRQGHITADAWGNDTARLEMGWISGYDHYLNGMDNRLKRVRAIQVNSTEGIHTLRNWLFDHLDGSSTGGFACFTTSSMSITVAPQLPQGTPEAGKQAVVAWTIDPVHGLVVVGYNDSIRYDVNDDGLYTNNLDITGDGIIDARDWEIGGFRIANSYGDWWSDNGFIYAMYRSFALDYEDGGIWNNRVFVVDADTGYRPLLTMKFRLDYNSREKIRIRAGIAADTAGKVPAHILDFPMFSFQGGDHPMQGYDSVPGSGEIEAGLDVTALLSYANPGQPVKLFFMTEERDPALTGNGTIRQVSFIYYGEDTTQFSCEQQDIPVANNEMTFVPVIANLDFEKVAVADEELPPYMPGQPYTAQLQAEGGRAPYTWSLLRNYAGRETDSVMPMVTQRQVFPQNGAMPYEAIPLPFQFPFYGKMYDTVYVNSTGVVTFEPVVFPVPYTTDELAMLRQTVCISPAYCTRYNYSLSTADAIWFEATESTATVRWKVSVMDYESTTENNFAVRMHASGRIEFLYGNIFNELSVLTVYTGISAGDGINHTLQSVWHIDALSGKASLYEPVELPPSLTLSEDGLLTVYAADSTGVYDIPVQVLDQDAISGSHVFQFTTGLTLHHQVSCGTGDRIRLGTPAYITMVLKNTGQQPITNLTLKFRPGDPAVSVIDSTASLPLLGPGETVTLTDAFRADLTAALPDNTSLDMMIRAESAGHSWNREFHLLSAAPAIGIQPESIADGDNNLLDRGEVADLVIPILNTGSLAAENLEARLESSDTVVTILSAATLGIGSFAPGAKTDLRYQLRASRFIEGGTDVSMKLVISNGFDVNEEYPFILHAGKKLCAVLKLSATGPSYEAITAELENLGVAFDTYTTLPFNYSGYDCIFTLLGTSVSGAYNLSYYEAVQLAGYLRRGGRMYMEGYSTWYYTNETPLHPMFMYESEKVPAWLYYSTDGVPGTFTGSMHFRNTSALNYAIFDFEPRSVAMATLVNAAEPHRTLEVAYDGETYKTIGTFLGFGSLADSTDPSTKQTLMKRYMEFFGLNITGPYPLFHSTSAVACLGLPMVFTDDSYDGIVSWSWEFPGGTPASSTSQNPVVVYDTPGTYDVRLTVSDGKNSRSLLRKQYVTARVCQAATEEKVSFFRIYPNPARTYIRIVPGALPQEPCAAELSDLTGRVLLRQSLVPGAAGAGFLLPLPAHTPGLYFLKVRSAGRVEVFRVILN
jgi:hypothetical protein